MRVKGNVRRAMIEEHLKTDELGTVPSHWLAHDLRHDLKDALGAEHPQARGGEDLPDLLAGEVEVARLTLVNSVHGEVTSLRARFDQSDGKLHFRLVDEYETEYALPRDTAALPLAPHEVFECFRNASPSPLDTSCTAKLSSYFYPDLDRLLPT